MQRKVLRFFSTTAEIINQQGTDTFQLIIGIFCSESRRKFFSWHESLFVILMASYFESLPFDFPLADCSEVLWVLGRCCSTSEFYPASLRPVTSLPRSARTPCTVCWTRQTLATPLVQYEDHHSGSWAEHQVLILTLCKMLDHCTALHCFSISSLWTLTKLVEQFVPRKYTQCKQSSCNSEWFCCWRLSPLARNPFCGSAEMRELCVSY